MRLKVFALLPLFLLAVVVAPVCAAGEPAPGGSSEQGAVSPSAVQSVPPEEFVIKANRLLGDVHAMASGVIMPLAGVAMVVSIGAIALGSLTGWGIMRRFGFGGLFTTCLGVFLFWGIPVILGVIRSLGMRFSAP